MADGITQAQKEFQDIIKRLEELKSGSALTTENIPTPKVLTSTQAKDYGMDIDMPDDWFMEVMPSPAGVEPEIKFIAPDLQEYNPADIYVDEQGTWMPSQQYNILEQRKQTETVEMFKRLYPDEFTGDIDEIYRTGEIVSRFEDEAFFNEFLTKVYSGGQTPESTRLLQFVMPEATQDDIREFFSGAGGVYEIPGLLMKALPHVVTEDTVDVMIDFFVENPENLRSALITTGRNEQTENVVKAIYPGITDRQIKNYFDPYWREHEKAAKKVPGWLGALASGMGELTSMVGGLSRIVGADGVAENMAQSTDWWHAYMPEDTLGEFEWSHLMNPIWWQNRVLPMVPSLYVLGVTSVAGAGWATAGTAGKLGAFGQTVLGKTLAYGTGALSGATVSRLMESGMESGAAYDEAIARGLTSDEAKEVSDKVFWDNMKLVGLDAAQLALALAPNPLVKYSGLINKGLAKTITVGGKLVGVGLTEGGEEVYQEIIKKKAFGEEITWTPEMTEVFALGSLAGLGFAGGAHAISRAKGNIYESMTTEEKKAFNEAKSESISSGESPEVAEQKGFDAVTDMSKEKVEEVIDRTEREIAFEQIKDKTEADKIVFERQTQVTPPETQEMSTELRELHEHPARLSRFGAEYAETQRYGSKELDAQINDYLNKLKNYAEKNNPKYLPEINALIREAEEGSISEAVISNERVLQKLHGDESVQVDEAIKSLTETAIRIPEQARVPSVQGVPEPSIPEEVSPEIPLIEEVDESTDPVDATLAHISFEGDRRSLIESVVKGWRNAKTQWLDRLYPIDRFTNEALKGNVELSFEENPYLMARMLEGVMSKANNFIEKGTFGRKFWKKVKGKAVPNYTGEGLETIFREVNSIANWKDFSAYVTALHALELSNYDITTGLSPDVAVATITKLNEKNPEFKGLADRLYQYQSRLLDYIQESGLIDQELRDKLNAKYFAYVPFYRVLEDVQAKGYMGKKMANIAKQIKRIKGSEKTIINPLESIVKNTYALINAADRNQVGILMARLVNENPELATMFEPIKTPISKVATVTAKELGIDIEGLNEDEMEGVFNIFRPSMRIDKDVATVMIDGKRKFFRVEPELRNALLAVDDTNWGIIGALLSYPAKWLRAGATLSPDFMARNPARDQMTAFVYSKYGFLPGIDFLRGIANVLGRTKTYELYKSSGAEHSMLVSLDRDYLQKSFNEVMSGKKFTDYVKHPLRLLQIVSELNEKATRVGEFAKGIRRGATPLEAGLSSREVTLDFAKAGNQARALNSIIAFFNANIRGWDRMITAFKEHPVKTSTKVFIGITLPSIILYGINKDDPRWKEIPQWQKDLFWIIMTEDYIYRIPKPFELGIIFGSVFERFLEYMDNQEPDMLGETFSNVAEAGLPGFLPTAILPIIENWTNYSFFRDREIVPESRQQYIPELQYTRYTSEAAKKIGDLTNYSPAKIENLINGWTGTLGRYGLNIVDSVLKGTGITPDIAEPTPKLADYPLARAFVIRNPYGSSSESVNRFYKITEEYTENENYLQEMLKSEDIENFESFKLKHPELLFFSDWETGEGYSATARYLRRVSNELSDITKEEDKIYESDTLNADQKREKIDKLEMAKTEITRRALENIYGSDILETQLKELENKLGQIKGEVPILSIDEPEINSMKDLYSDSNYLLEMVTSEDLSSYSPIWQSRIQTDEIKNTLKALPSVAPYQINAYPEEGDTYIELYKQWQERSKITDLEELKAFDSNPYTKNSYMGNLTKQQLYALDLYHKATTKEEKQDILEQYPIIAQDSREAYLASHHEENALYALWGQSKLYSKAAYEKLKSLSNEFDIPYNAISDTLPPEDIADSYFEYLETSDQYGSQSPQIKLMLYNNDELRKYLSRARIDTDPRILQFNVDWYEENNLYDSYSDTESENYIPVDRMRANARDILKTRTNESGETYGEALRRVEAIRKEIPDEYINDYIYYYEHLSETLERKIWLLDNDDYYNDIWLGLLGREPVSLPKQSIYPYQLEAIGKAR